MKYTLQIHITLQVLGAHSIFTVISLHGRGSEDSDHGAERKVTPLPGRPSIPRRATPRISVSPSPRDRGGWIPSAWISDAPPGRPGGPSYRFPTCRPRTVAPIRRPPLLSLFATPPDCTSKFDAWNRSALITSTCAYPAMGFGKWIAQLFQIFFNRMRIPTQSGRHSGASSPSVRM